MNKLQTWLEDESNNQKKCGYIAIVGRPNVGKSTLLNVLLGQKLSITSRKPQTTRHQILGIKTSELCQAIYVDTPGLHQKTGGKAINRYMNRAATSALKDVDVVIMVVDRNRWVEADEQVCAKLQHLSCPLFIAVNKLDRLSDRGNLLPHLQYLQQQLPNAESVPISARHGTYVERLGQLVEAHLPYGQHVFPADQVTDRSVRFVAAELVREKIMRQMGDELPYQITVQIEDFSQENDILYIAALILVERSGQKAILIGDQGKRLKTIGRDARLDMERMFDSRVMLNLWVKVQGGWSNNEQNLRSLGYDGLE